MSLVLGLVEQVRERGTALPVRAVPTETIRKKYVPVLFQQFAVHWWTSDSIQEWFQYFELTSVVHLQEWSQEQYSVCNLRFMSSTHWL